MEQEKQQEINKFMSIRLSAELRALSNYSLENQLTDEQYERMVELKNILFKHEVDNTKSKKEE